MLERVAGEQRDDLVGSRQSEMRAPVGRKLRDVGAEQLDLSGIRPHVAADLVEQRGLAGAVRADDQAAFARPDRKRYVLRDDEAAERLLQVDDLERVVGCRRGHRDPPRSRATSLLQAGNDPGRHHQNDEQEHQARAACSSVRYRPRRSSSTAAPARRRRPGRRAFPSRRRSRRATLRPNSWSRAKSGGCICCNRRRAVRIRRPRSRHR